MGNSKIKLSREDHVMNSLANTVVIVCLILTLYPLWYCVVYAFNDGVDSIKGGVYFWPRAFTLDNFALVLRNGKFLHAFAVTVARTVLGTILSVSVLMLAAYALFKKNLYFRKFYMMLYVIATYIGGGTIPYYLTLRNLGLLNSFWVYILPGMGVSLYNMMLVQAFMRALPDSLDESAIIDGCGYFRAFLKIILPLCKPVIATMALFAAVGHWNDWYSTAYYTTSESLMTLSTYLTKLIQEEMARLSAQSQAQYSVTKAMLGAEALRYAALVLTIAPIITIYPFCQKYFVKGMLVGAVKA